MDVTDKTKKKKKKMLDTEEQRGCGMEQNGVVWDGMWEEVGNQSVPGTQYREVVFHVEVSVINPDVKQLCLREGTWTRSYEQHLAPGDMGSKFGSAIYY